MGSPDNLLTWDSNTTLPLVRVSIQKCEDGPDQAHLLQPACACRASQAGVGIRGCQVRRRPTAGSVGQPKTLGCSQADNPVWSVPSARVGRGGDRPVYGHHQVPGSTVRVEG